jgi:hypothetical protein
MYVRTMEGTVWLPSALGLRESVKADDCPASSPPTQERPHHGLYAWPAEEVLLLQCQQADTLTHLQPLLVVVHCNIHMLQLQGAERCEGGWCQLTLWHTVPNRHSDARSCHPCLPLLLCCQCSLQLAVVAASLDRCACVDRAPAILLLSVLVTSTGTCSAT